eukprot:m.12538 g.12538  ORF g.12538 m.12538 type:complete len:378 (-) comp4560_c0_seq1:3484-4617(-)
MNFFPDETSPYDDGFVHDLSLDSTHVVPSDSQWNYPGLLSDPLLDSTELFAAPETTQFESLNDLFSVPTGGETMFKTNTEPVMFKSEATDRYWGCGGMSAKSSAAPPQPLSEWDAPTEKGGTLSAQLTLTLSGENEKGNKEKRPRARKPKKKNNGATKARVPKANRARSSRTSTDKPNQSSAELLDFVARAPTSRFSKRPERVDLMTPSKPMLGCVSFVSAKPSPLPRTPLQERNRGVVDQPVAVASLVEYQRLPLVVRRTVPVSVRASNTAVDQYTRKGLSLAPKLPRISIATTNRVDRGGFNQYKGDLGSGAPVPIFTKEIVSAEAVIRPSVQRVQQGQKGVPLRRRRGLTPLKIVNPEAILRAAFTRVQSSTSE